jgi:transcriptional regulator with XRE-family HTH domain
MGDFLRKRRAALTPADVGLMDYGTRRVPGLRREEVAMLAGMSVTYYARLEQGQHINASDAVIDSLARALALTEVERKHLVDLSGHPSAAQPRPCAADRIRSAPEQSASWTQWVPCPTLVLGKRTEVLAWNQTGHRLVASHLDFDAPDTASGAAEHDPDALPGRGHTRPVPTVAHRGRARRGVPAAALRTVRR